MPANFSPVHNPDPLLGFIYLVLILSGISIVSVFLSYIINGFIQYFCVKLSVNYAEYIMIKI